MSGEDRDTRAENRSFVQLEQRIASIENDVQAELEALRETVLNHSTELDQLEDSMAADNHNCRGANVPLMPFYGNRDEDFGQYLKRFELVCDANNYAPDKRAQILASYLKDKAFYVYDSLTDAEKADYDALKRALAEKFQTTDYQRYAHQKFQGRRQLENESVTNYGCVIHRLGMSALASVETDQRDALIREKFISGLLPHLHELIVYSNPKNFHEAMTFAERLEGVQSTRQKESPRHVMLLESLHDRISQLEIIPRRSETSFPNTGNGAYAVGQWTRPNNPRRAFQTTGRNIGNYRQEFRPGGIICYKCNRTGHIARNCPRNQNMNRVVCRSCNATGHFARDCQRRSVLNRGRPPMNRNQNSQFQSNFRPTQTHTGTVALTENHKAEPGTEGNERRWHPLVGSLRPVTLVDSSWKVETNQPKSCMKNCVRKGLKFGKSLASWVTPRFLLIVMLLVLAIQGTTATEKKGGYQNSAPMLCQVGEAKSMWQLPRTFNCPQGNHSMDQAMEKQDFLLYKKNYIQYKTKAWKCVKVTEEAETFTYFFGDENLKSIRKYSVPVSSEECIAMKQFKKCGTEQMVFQGGIYQTVRTLDWYYPGGGINCCHWKKFTVTNCYMYESRVYKRHGSTEMESAAGDVSACNYKEGQCVLKDSSFLIWNVNRKSFCNLLPWKTVPGTSYGSSWLSDDSNLALTFSRRLQTKDCDQSPLMMSDQGIAAKRIESATPRERRQVSVQDIQIMRDFASKGGVVSSAQLAASLQAFEVETRKNTNFAFSHALNSVCNFMRTVVELLRTQVLANPTNAVRILTNQSDSFARAGGNVIEIYPCQRLRKSDYSFKSMNKSCTSQVPIEFKINNETHKGYLDPLTNIVHRYGIPIDCNLIREVPLQINDKTRLYNAVTGATKRPRTLPVLDVPQWNIEPLVNMKATIFHEIVIYSWSELQTHISLNDIMGGLAKQQEVLRKLGISSSDEEPGKAADKAVSTIMDTGYFGFLRGLPFNFLQMWTFCICLYVTICIIIVHCLPINGIPAILNLPRLLWNGLQRLPVHKLSDRLTRARPSAPPGPQDEQPRSAGGATSWRWTTQQDSNKRLMPATTTLALENFPIRPLRALPPPVLKSVPVPKDCFPLEQTRMQRRYPSLPTIPETVKDETQPFRINGVTTEGMNPEMQSTLRQVVILTKLDDMEVRALLDTGSSLTIIPLSVAKKLRGQITSVNVKATSITGHSLKVIGEVAGTVNIADIVLRGRIIVTEECPYDFVIGTDLLSRLGRISFDFDERKVKIGRKSVQCEPVVSATAAVFLCQQIRIPPQTKAVVMGVCHEISPGTLDTSRMCEFSPSEKLLTKYEVLSDRSVVKPCDRLIPVNVCNKDAAPKFMPEAATLGSIRALDQEEQEMVKSQNANEERYLPAWPRRSKPEMEEFREKLIMAPELLPEDEEKLRSLIERYEILFARSEYDLGQTTLAEHAIETGGARPIRQLAYRTPHSLRPVVSEKIQKMMEHGIIQPSKSNWSSPIVMVKKKETSDLRFCVDNTKLNDVTVKDNYPLKRLEDGFDMLHGAKCFAIMDLQNGYLQIPVRKEDQCKTAFITQDGLFEFTKMNFGLCNGPATFQRLMDQVLRGLDQKICINYMDDIVVPAKSISQLTERLKLVFDKLLDAGLKLKVSKCKFGLQEIKFLGYIVGKDGLKADPAKIQKIADARPPQNRTQLQAFLGFVGWCKRFIRNYAHIAEPLTKLLQQSQTFKWTPNAQTAFDQLKLMYVEPPILTFPNLKQPFIICTDASNAAIGAVLCQNDETGKEKPISYDSRVLNSSEKSYSTIEREMLAIFWAVTKKYKVYVYGNTFTVYTDHKPLLGIWKSPPSEGRLGRWCIRMLEYRGNMTLEYRAGKTNVVADYLSRLPSNAVVATIQQNPDAENADLRKLQEADNIFGPMISFLEDRQLPKDHQQASKIERLALQYEIVDNVLYKRSQKANKLVLAVPKEKRQQILIATHDSLLGGHLGVRKTLSKIEGKYFWPGYYNDVVSWCKNCWSCQTRKGPHQKQKAPMKPITVGHINQKWAWDICGKLPLSRQGNRYILVCMEYFSKFPEVFAIPDTKAERLAKIFVENIVLRYGCPEVLISDQGLNVHSKMIQEICKSLDIDKLRTSAYHPQTDGMVERFNRTLQNMISMYVNEGHTDWCEFLPFVVFAYRASIHETTKESPFFLMYGYDPLLPVDISTTPTISTYLESDDDYKLFVLSSLLKSRRIVAETIPKQQDRQKRIYDRGAEEHSFLEGDRVLIYTPVTKVGRSRKFARCWKGPYRVIKVSENGTNVQVEGIGQRRSQNQTWVHVNRVKRMQDATGPWSLGPQEQHKHALGEYQPTPQSQRHMPSPNKDVCAKCKKRGKATTWIACDICNKWYHFKCVGITITPVETLWTCPKCKGNALETEECDTGEDVRDPNANNQESDSSVQTIDGDDYP